MPAPEWRIAGRSADLWRWSLTPAAFESAVGYGTDWIVVDASYDTTFGDMSEEVSVSSALVPHATAVLPCRAASRRCWEVVGGSRRLTTTVVMTTPTSQKVTRCFDSFRGSTRRTSMSQSTETMSVGGTSCSASSSWVRRRGPVQPDGR